MLTWVLKELECDNINCKQMVVIVLDLVSRWCCSVLEEDKKGKKQDKEEKLML